jgi:hypothetical protein
MKQTLILFAALAAVLISGCKMPTGPVVMTSSGAASGTVYMWIAPIVDTKIDADAPDMNFYKAPDNTFARAHIPGTTAWYVKSFVKIQLPRLPEGTKIDEAYFEMFHSGTTEDGTTDNTSYHVSEVGVPWRADSITWKHSPDGGTLSSGLNVLSARIHSNDWSGTEDISGIVKNWFADSSKNNGFRIELGDNQNLYKSFYSNNSFIGSHNSDGRSDSTVGKAPRIVVKIELPAGKTTADIKWNAILPDNDLTFGSFSKRTNHIIQAIYASGTQDFPAEWGVKKGR